MSKLFFGTILSQPVCGGWYHDTMDFDLVIFSIGLIPSAPDFLSLNINFHSSEAFLQFGSFAVDDKKLWDDYHDGAKEEILTSTLWSDQIGGSIFRVGPFPPSDEKTH